MYIFAGITALYYEKKALFRIDVENFGINPQKEVEKTGRGGPCLRGDDVCWERFGPIPLYYTKCKAFQFFYNF